LQASCGCAIAPYTSSSRRAHTLSQLHPKSTLSGFTAYLLEHRLDAFVAAQIARITPYDLPLMRFFAHLPAEEVHAISRESTQGWLTAMRDQQLPQHRKAELQRWRDNQLGHNIGRENITLTDIIHVYAAQRATLISFLGEYAESAADCAAIALEIEDEYGVTEKSALDVLEEVAAERQARLTESTQQIEEQRARIEGLIAHAPDAVVVIDEDGIIRLWNSKAEEVFGWTEEEAVGQPLAETIIPPVYREAHAAGMKRYLTTGVAHVLHQVLSLKALHRHGHEFPISLTLSGFRQGGRQHFVSFTRDVTEQHRTAAALENHRKELEARAEELEQYAWLVSHDLKEPLRKISMFADILEHRFAQHLPEEGKAYVQRMSGATQRMSSLIDAVLAYANVSRVVEEKVPVDLADVLAEATTNLELLIAETDARISVQLSLPPVPGVRVQLVQVFENLLANAMKYRKPGVAPQISVEGEKSGERIFIRVRDNGVGFDEEYAEKIFAPFQRLHTREAQAGTGIGLALCRKIVELHYGRISAQSVEGEGSTFTLELPPAS
jgi:PAS domain S-box-containing protein